MWELHGGVLILGSLLWDDDPTRVKWRKDWLNLDRAVQVLAPIRYGRLSRKRGCTYTMVFSRLCLRRSYTGGTAVAVPFSRPVLDIDSLLAAAHALWGAEDKSQNLQRSIAASWGAIGLMVNSKRDYQELKDGWSQVVRAQQCYRIPTHLKSEGPILDSDSGLLLISWPNTASGELLDLDFLLATATDPELIVTGQRYPSPAQIAARWIADQSGEVEYFLENRKHGIHTFQDKRIRKYLLREGIKSV